MSVASSPGITRQTDLCTLNSWSLKYGYLSMRSHKIMFYNMMIKNRLRAMDFSRTQLGRMCWVLINPRADQIESTFMYILYTILMKKMWSYSGVAVSLGQAQIL